jgi:hypothetical protein
MRVYRGEPFLFGAVRQVNDDTHLGCWFTDDPRRAMTHMQSDGGQLYLLDLTPDQSGRCHYFGTAIVVPARFARHAVPVPLNCTRHPEYDADHYGVNVYGDPQALDEDGYWRVVQHVPDQ